MLNKDHQHERKDILHVVVGGDYPGEDRVLGVFNNKGVAVSFAKEVGERNRYYVVIVEAELNRKFEVHYRGEGIQRRTPEGQTYFEWNDEHETPV